MIILYILALHKSNKVGISVGQRHEELPSSMSKTLNANDDMHSMSK